MTTIYDIGPGDFILDQADCKQNIRVRNEVLMVIVGLAALRGSPSTEQGAHSPHW